MSRRRHGAHNTRLFLISLLLLCVLLGALYRYGDALPPTQEIEASVSQGIASLPEGVKGVIRRIYAGAQGLLGGKSPETVSTGTPLEPIQPGELRVYSFCVGDADAHLLQLDGQTLLIDAGDNKHQQEVLARLHDLGVERLTAVVATHPHEDHIGGMAEVIEAFSPQTCYLPEKTHTTKTYSDLLDALEAGETQAVCPEPGDTMALGGATVTFLGPVRGDYTEMNDYSIVLRVEYQGVSFLFTGDAEQSAERDLLESGADLRADVLKIAHHGSATSSSEAFLRAVSPRYAFYTNDDASDLDDQVRKNLERLGAVIVCTQSGEIQFSVKNGVLDLQVAAPENSLDGGGAVP